MELSDIYRKKDNIFLRKIENEYILVPLIKNIVDMNIVYSLNSTGGFIWEQLDGKKDIRNLAFYLTKEFEVDLETAQNDVMEYLEKLTEVIEKKVE
ncbi:MAG: PqqD family protein [Bacteroidia bacterium]|nr:PqqD family protein [Bacteroidia bacterium]